MSDCSSVLNQKTGACEIVTCINAIRALIIYYKIQESNREQKDKAQYHQTLLKAHKRLFIYVHT